MHVTDVAKYSTCIDQFQINLFLPTAVKTQINEMK